MVADSTSLNLYKVLQRRDRDRDFSPPRDARGPRRRILSERSNFPTDLYIAETLAGAHGFALTLVDDADIADALSQKTPDGLTRR